MKLKFILLCAVQAALCHTSQAANVAKQWIDQNSQVCEQFASMPDAKKIDPYVPGDKKQAPAYCNCVSKKYWSQVPQADFDGMLAEMQRGDVNGPRGQAISKALDQRMETARKSCSG
jgi:hypothetical protein